MAEPIPTLDPEVGVSGDGGTGSGYTRLGTDSEDAESRVQQQLWWAFAAVWRAKWWILATTILVAGLAVWLTLQIPDRYRAETRVLLPDSGSSGLAAMFGRSASSAAALLGGSSGGGYTRYLALLSSRTTLEDVVERYDLVRQYETQSAPDPVAAAVSKLSKRTTFDVSLEFDYLAVRVLDEDPQRAAQMANTFVEILNRENVALNQESAATNRVYLERRLERADLELDSLLNQMQALQERYGVVQPEAQGAALMDALSSAAALVAQAEVGYQMLRSELGDENDQTQAAAAGLAAARAQRDRLTSGSESMMPVAIGQLPEIGRRYAGIQQGIVLQSAIQEALQPLYEQALLTESRRADAVQVIDPAVPPARKAEPRRSLMVIAATLSAFLVALALALALALWRAGAPGVLARLRAETAAR